jgi:hypothetical protein
MAVTVTHSKTLIAPDSGVEDKVYGVDYVAPDSHSITGLGSAAEADATSFDTAGSATDAVAAHVADSADPHAAAGYITQTEADAAYPPLAHDHTGAGQALIPVEALASENSPANRYIWSALGATGEGKWITTTIYPATSVSLIVGTLNAGSITSFATRNDADIYDVQEVAATPGVDVRVSFANVTAFNLLRFQVDHIDGTGTHKTEYALWNVNTSAWDLLTSLRTTNGFVEADVNADDFVNYIDTGSSNTVICRMSHPLAGAGAHQHRWEYMVLVDSIAGGGGISEHQALSGLDTAGSHPATAISNSPSGTISSTTVQAAINELNSDATTHLADLANPHSTTKTQVGLGNVTDDAQLKRAAGDINSFTLKGTPVGADVVLIEDSAAGFAKAKATITSIAAAGGGYTTIEDEGTPLALRATANFVGSGVTVTDAGGKTVVTIPGAAGSTDIKATTVTVATPATEASFTVTDGDVTGSSQINVGWGNCAQSDANHPGMGAVAFNAIAGTGQFTVEVYSLDGSNLFGPFKLNYLIG